MKKSILSAVVLLTLLVSCKKETIPVQSGSLVGHWSMQSATITDPTNKDSFFGPDFSIEWYREIFSECSLIITDSVVMLQNTQNPEESLELGRYRLKDEGYTLEIQAEDEESIGVYRIESFSDGRFLATDESGVRLEFVKTK